ncbi:MAG TPA: hypothetical protein PKY96_04955 [Flavobacteriales bacterium]|nr:hypothetical protein [Flavobacteriales bacterium]
MKARTLILIGAVALAIGGWYGYSEFNRGHADLSESKADFTLEADELLAAFVNDEAAANSQYVEKVVKVSGTIREVTNAGGTAPANVTLETDDEMAGIACEFKQGTLPAAWKAGDKVLVKGVCTGYTGGGMLPGDVILQRCVTVE